MGGRGEGDDERSGSDWMATPNWHESTDLESSRALAAAPLRFEGESRIVNGDLAIRSGRQERARETRRVAGSQRSRKPSAAIA